jgi:hypothetical protein
MTDAELIGRLKAILGRAGTPDDDVLRAALIRFDELARAAPRRSVPVRIAVAIGDGGGWSAWGQSGRSDDDMCEEALGQIGDDHRACYIVTADVPVPEVRDIEGRVGATFTPSD